MTERKEVAVELESSKSREQSTLGGRGRPKT
jgi:hypothetical protein